MPAPPFTNEQAIPTCPENGGTALDETSFDRGSITVNANCCRTFGTKVRLGSRILEHTGESGGDQIFESDSFNLCGRQSKTFTGSHSGIGTISGATFSGHANGVFSAGLTGTYEIFINGTLTSADPDGSFTGTLGGVLGHLFIEADITGTIVDGVVTATYTVTNLAGITLTQTSNTFTITSPTTFNFAGTFSGSQTAELVVAYLKLKWSHCEPNGLLIETLKVSDDSLIAKHANKHYAMRQSRQVLLNRIYVACPSPCTDIVSPVQVRGLIQQVICLHASTS